MYVEFKQFVVQNRLEVESQKTIAALTDNNTKLIDAEKVRNCFCP